MDKNYLIKKILEKDDLYDEKELKSYSFSELESILEEYDETETMFPNGRDDD